MIYDKEKYKFYGWVTYSQLHTLPIYGACGGRWV